MRGVVVCHVAGVQVSGHQDVLIAQVQQINSQIERIGNMRRSLAKLERGAARLRIRR